VLIPLPQIGSALPKLRPALLLANLPGPYQNQLLCGISTQLHLLQAHWDELVQTTDADFSLSGLHRTSAIRLSYLYALTPVNLPELSAELMLHVWSDFAEGSLTICALD
jgi:mRNA interferase MazF